MDKPTIRFVDPVPFNEKIIQWLFDKDGNRSGFIERVEMTQEEVEKIYGVPESKPNTAFKEFAKHYFPRGD